MSTPRPAPRALVLGHIRPGQPPVLYLPPPENAAKAARKASKNEGGDPTDGKHSAHVTAGEPVGEEGADVAEKAPDAPGREPAAGSPEYLPPPETEEYASAKSRVTTTLAMLDYANELAVILLCGVATW